MIAFTLC